MTSLQIKYFLLSARYLNFTRTAEECFTTQPTVSRQIALLEQELGFSLFLRQGKVLHITPEGELMYRELARTSEIIDDATHRAKRMQQGIAGSLSVGFLTGMNTDIFIVPPIIRFMKQNPRTKVMVETASFTPLRELLTSGKLDVIFTYNYELDSMEDVEYKDCYPVFPVATFSAEHWLARKPDLSLRDLEGETFILPDTADSYRGASELKDMLAHHGVNNVKVRYLDNIETVDLSLRSGMGVALMDTARRLYFDDRFISLSLPDDFQHPLSLVAVWLKPNENPAITQYLEVFQQKGDIDVFSN